MHADLQPDQPDVRDGYIQAGNAALYYRTIGQGQPIIVLHGGPDFDHTYLLPQMDFLSDSFRLIYYDQRGRGRSAINVQPEDVSIASEMHDLESVREFFQFDSVVLLGHSWGGLLAMEYATRHPERVSHLILMNTAPVSRDELAIFVQERRDKTPDVVEQLKVLSASDGYLRGDPEAVAAYYRVHFSPTLTQPGQLEPFVTKLMANTTSEGILRAREIETRLYHETWLADDYDLLARLRRLDCSTLIMHGEQDFIPLECVAPIAQAIPGSRLVVLNDCGHFSYLDQPDEVGTAIDAFMHTAP